MTPDRTKELLPVITAFAEGKKIQVKCQCGWPGCEQYNLETNPTWADNRDYRIMPEKQKGQQ